MNSRLAVLLVPTGFVAVLAGALLPWGVAIPVTGVTVALALAVGHRLVTHPLRRAAAEVDVWLRQEHHRALRLPAGTGWRQLEVSLNALGAAYHRRGIKLRRERPWRRELVDSLVSAALLFSAEDRLLAANDAARALFAIPNDPARPAVAEATGSTALAGAVHEARDTGLPVTLDVEQADRELRCVVSLVGDELLVIVTDRTAERRVEELRRNFVVNASHELKTPVTSIRTLAEALEITARDDPSQLGPLITRLGGEAERLARLVYDLLDLRRLEEREPTESGPVDLAELVRDVVADLVERAERRDVELVVEAPDEVIVTGAAGELRIVVKNLVANGIQYNRPGGTVEVGVQDDGGATVLTVRDTGIGIPPAEHGRIFERFYRVDAARSRETGGTGLGLSLVRHAVERHGGTIRVDSRPDEGTVFTVTFPHETPSRG